MGCWGLDPARSGPGRRWRRTGAAGLLALLALVAAACGDDGSDDTTGAAGSGTTGTTGLPSCEEHHTLVVFHLNGVLTPDHHEFSAWMADPDHVMATRDGAVDLVNAYYDLGFHIAYTSRGDAELIVHDVPYDEAVTEWIESQGFPLDDRAQLRAGTDATALTDLLVSAGGRQGGGVYAAYTSAEEDLVPLSVAGVPEDRIYLLGDLVGEAGGTPVPGGDLGEHMSLVGDLDPVCAP